MKTKVVNLILAVCFIVLLINLNSIMAMFRPSAKPGPFPESNVRARAHIDSYGMDSKENLQINGWAFAETAGDSENRRAEVILEGVNNCYRFEVPVFGERADVRASMKKEGYLIETTKVGFSLKFSTICVKSGTYNISIFCTENENAKGIAYTGYQLVKKGREMSVRTNSSGILQTVKPHEQVLVLPETSVARGNIEMLAIQDVGSVQVEGWSFCETEQDNNSKAISVILKSEDGVYAAETTLKDRVDVHDVFSPSFKVQGNLHGFATVIDPTSLPDGEYQVLLFCEESEGVSGIYESSKWIEKTGDTVTDISEQKNNVPTEEPVVEQHEKNSVSPVKYHEPVEAANNVAYNVEVLTVEGPDVSIEGWAFCETEADNSGKAITLLLKGKEEVYAVETELKARKDVLDCFASERKIQGENHGFRTEFEMSSLPDGTYELLILCQETPETGNVTQTAISIEKSGNEINILR